MENNRGSGDKPDFKADRKAGANDHTVNKIVDSIANQVHVTESMMCFAFTGVQMAMMPFEESFNKIEQGKTN